MSASRQAHPRAKQYSLVGPDRKPYLNDTPGAFGGHRGGLVFGRLGCRAALQAIQRGGYVDRRVFFADTSDAVLAGYRPCAVCMPNTYRAWKIAGRPDPSRVS
jgi:hypothetical protein